MKDRLLFSLCALSLLWSCNDSPKQERIVVVNGESIAIPHKIERIADAWHAHNMIVAMLGFGDKIVVTSVNEQLCPWFFKINSGMDAVTSFSPSGVGSMEELVKARPDVVFMANNNTQNAKQIEQLGYPLLNLSFFDFDGLRQTVLKTGEILGEPAVEGAEAYVAYLDQKIAMISEKVNTVPKDEKPRVLHITALDPLTVNGSNSIMDAWIKLAGGINAAAEINGNSKQVSAEQVLLWNPDIIIYAGTSKAITHEDFTDNIKLKQTKAVTENKIYINPKGMFFWDRYSAEGALQIQWAAKTFYPDKFEDVDIVDETVAFYHQFFEYPLTREEAQMIIDGIPPPVD